MMFLMSSDRLHSLPLVIRNINFLEYFDDRIIEMFNYVLSFERSLYPKSCTSDFLPATKLAHAEKFNDPDHPCKVMVATDAIGMGLNL